MSSIKFYVTYGSCSKPFERAEVFAGRRQQKGCEWYALIRKGELDRVFVMNVPKPKDDGLGTNPKSHSSPSF